MCFDQAPAATRAACRSLAAAGGLARPREHRCSLRRSGR